ncbi:YlxQ family RNA-binding protein [Bhargavaea cecembensis]|uniref:YlxQ family RNA-binding protein n=1 Tax=Bhargavaea cecembensis TaxID=394098 RepID=UPI0005912D33|nr:YlxQ family RNA-binding protein [Bhargavaea cecembensis]
MSRQKIFNLIGLAARARKITTGEELALSAIRNGSARLVILSEDASDNTAGKIRDKSAHYRIPMHAFGTRYELGHAIGKEARVVLAITDSGFAKKLSSLLREQEEE